MQKYYFSTEKYQQGLTIREFLKALNISARVIKDLTKKEGLILVNDKIAFINQKLKSGKSKCIQETYCPHKQCPLYGTCGGGKKPKEDNRCDCGCERNDKLLDTSKLIIKSVRKPRYR